MKAAKRARLAAAMDTIQRENRAKDAALKREHFRLVIVERCLKKQPGYGWMSLRTIRESTELDPAEFLERLEDDPNVEVMKDDKGTRLRYVVSSEYTSHVDVEYRTAVEETPPSATRAPESAALPDIERLDNRFTNVQRIFNLVRNNDVRSLRRELPDSDRVSGRPDVRTSHLMTPAELMQRLNEPYEWYRYRLDGTTGKFFLVHLVQSKEMLELLHQKLGLDLEAQRPDDGSTLLHLCVTNPLRDVGLFEYLLQAGCSALVRNHRGLTALDEAVVMLNKSKRIFREIENGGSAAPDQTLLLQDAEVKKRWEIVMALEGMRYAPSGTGAVATAADFETRRAGGDGSAAAAAAAAAVADVEQRDEERRASRGTASAPAAAQPVQMYFCYSCDTKFSFDELTQDAGEIMKAVEEGFYRCPQIGCNYTLEEVA